MKIDHISGAPEVPKKYRNEEEMVLSTEGLSLPNRVEAVAALFRKVVEKTENRS